MHQIIIHRFDSDDSKRVVGAAQAIESWFADEILPDERATTGDRACDGLKAIRAIKGNAFTIENVFELQAYAETLFDRRRQRIDKVKTERDAESRDGPSLSAYDFLIESMRNGLAEAERLVADFRDAVLASKRIAA